MKRQTMKLNGEHLILLPIDDGKSNYLDGFWRWVEIPANGDYQRAIESLYWASEPAWTPETLKHRVTTFFGGEEPWSVVIPNQRLIGVINDAAEVQPPNSEGRGWLLAQIPLTTQPDDPKNDEIPLMGLASSFFIREHGGHYVMEFEIFHL